MTRKPAIAFLAALAALCAGIGAPAADHQTTLSLRADGTSQLTLDRTESRSNVERETQMWDRFQNEGDNDLPAPATAPPGPKPLSDEELARKIRKMMEARSAMMGEDLQESVDVLKVASNQVHIVTRRTFRTLEEMLPQLPGRLNLGGIFVENIRLETNAQGSLVVTLTPSGHLQSYGKRMLQGWKLAGSSAGVRIEFPGPVLSSALPATGGQATWFKFDPTQAGAVDAVIKLHQSSMVITADVAGFKLTGPLDLKTLRRSGLTDESTVGLPITEAGPGFVAEATSISTTILHRFPDAPSGTRSAARLDSNPAGTLIRAKVFPPKGRTIQSVSGVRILKAVDDRGRPIPAPTNSNENAEESMMMNVVGRGNRAGGGLDLSLQLQLPQSDARSIEEVAAEAIIVSTGRWREMLLTNLTENATNELDLSGILPGARIVITKITTRNRQTSIQARLTGPPSIRDIEVDLPAPAGRRGGSNANTSDRGFSTRDGRATRTLQIDRYSYDGNEPEEPDGGTRAISLRVRYPEDRKRERFQFVLRELDLL